MSRTTILVLVALGAALAGFALSTNARRAQDEPSARPELAAAGPQQVELDWRERLGPEGEQLVFSVDSLEVLPEGWRARIGLENETSVSYEVGGPSSMTDSSFGLMLFETGATAELEQENEDGTLPAARRALRFEPSLPRLLEPGASWAGTISAPGALVADSWARVVFGPLVSVGKPPEDLEGRVVWITDHAHQLRP
jgi:hypothetical protein